MFRFFQEVKGKIEILREAYARVHADKINSPIYKDIEYIVSFVALVISIVKTIGPTPITLAERDIYNSTLSSAALAAFYFYGDVLDILMKNYELISWYVEEEAKLNKRIEDYYANKDDKYARDETIISVFENLTNEEKQRIFDCYPDLLERDAIGTYFLHHDYVDTITWTLMRVPLGIDVYTYLDNGNVNIETEIHDGLILMEYLKKLKYHFVDAKDETTHILSPRGNAKKIMPDKIPYVIPIYNTRLQDYKDKLLHVFFKVLRDRNSQVTLNDVLVYEREKIEKEYKALAPMEFESPRP